VITRREEVLRPAAWRLAGAALLVQEQISHWRAVGRHCLAEAERCRSMQEVALDLRQRLEQAK
jgi:hypothetical protein